MLRILFLLLISGACFSQDLYNFENSFRYAKHLKTSRIYKSAIAEYERLLFIQPQNDTIIKDLTFCYNKTEQFGKTTALLDTISNRDRELTLSLMTAHFNSRNYDHILALAAKEKETDKLFIPAALAMKRDYKGSIKNIDSLLATHQDIRLGKLKAETEKYLNTGKKSPLAAASLSLVPGLGKVYTKDYSDALLSFIMTGGLAFQTYRGFSKNGVKSAYGWIYGGLALGFYSGNIYGSWKAAKKFNQKKTDAYDAKVRDILFSDK